MQIFHRVIALVLVVLAAGFALAPGAQAQKIDDEAWLDAMEWRLIGPWRGGRATAVAGHPSDDQFYLMGATGVARDEHAAGRAHQVELVVGRMPGHGRRAAAPPRPDQPPLHRVQPGFVIDLLGLRPGRKDEAGGKNNESES